MKDKEKLVDKIKHRLETTGWYILRYRKIYLGLLILISIFEAIMIVNALIQGNYVKPRNIVYLVAYILLFAASITTAIILLAIRKKKNSPILLSILVHVYSIFMVAWSTLISCADMMVGSYPIVYLTILMTVCGLVSLSPLFVLGLIGVSLPFVFVYAWIYRDLVSFATMGGVFNIVVFILMTLIVAFRMYYVTMSESNYKNFIRKNLVTDPLTGLGNERKFVKLSEKIDNEYSNYAVVMMDLNNLKKTNDTYGHRFGCHLVVTAGKTLPSIFPNSELFHIGGDEYVAIVINEDLANLNKLLEDFDNKLSCTYITYDNIELLLSVARGVAIKEDGETFTHVYSRADKDMYINKPILKSKIGIN